MNTGFHEKRVMCVKEISFNYVADHGEMIGYREIIYIDKNGKQLEFDEWQKLSFEILNAEGSLFLNSDK